MHFIVDVGIAIMKASVAMLMWVIDLIFDAF